MAILLYLLDIIICIIIELYVNLSMTLFYVLLAGVSILCGFFIMRITVGSRPGILRYFHPDATREHIVTPLVFLILILFPLIVWLISPEFGPFFFSMASEINIPIFLIFSSFPLGTILSLPKELASDEKGPESENSIVSIEGSLSSMVK